MDPALAAGDFPRPPRLGQRPLDRILDQLLVPLPPRATMVHLRDRPPGHIETVGVHRAERPYAAGQCPIAGGKTIGDGDALAAFYEREDITPAHPYRVDRSHGRMSLDKANPWET